MITNRVEAAGPARRAVGAASDPRPLWLIYLVAGFFAIAIYFVLPHAWQVRAYDLFGVSATIAVVVGTLRFRPASPWA